MNRNDTAVGNRSAVMDASLSMMVDRSFAGTVPAFSGPQELKAGCGSAQIPPGLFLAVNNNNHEVAMQQRAQKGRRRHADPRQLDFLGLVDPAAETFLPPAAPVEGDPDQHVRDLLNDAIKASPLDRDQIAACMTVVIGREVTKAMLDCWTGASRPHRFPMSMAPAFCQAVGNTMLLAGLAEMSGCRLIEGFELQQARLRQINLYIRIAKQEARRITDAMPLFQGARHG